MEVELWCGTAKAIIDPKGAWLTNLSDDYGDVLFPKRSLKTDEGAVKLRGGSHVCLPNFGPGGKSGQPQHGFGRLVDWEVSDKTDSSILLTLTEGNDGYADMSSVLMYQLKDQALITTLEVTNNGQAELRVAPAFHPYFALGKGRGPVILNNEKQPLEELAEAQFFSGKTQTLKTPGCTFILESEELTTWAKWTDQLAPYVCVEPSLGGFTFLNDESGADEILAAGKTKQYRFSIKWQR